jgi:MFS-type transporter involved in bile tolerance (Atg22 family)
MVLGIVWAYWIGSILAVIFGHVALRRIAREGKAGRGMAIAGLVLGYIGVATLVIVIVAAVVSAEHSGSG